MGGIIISENKKEGMNMSKYFKTDEEFNNWIVEFQKHHREKYGNDLFSQLFYAPELTSEDYINGLIEDGYTDLDNLVLGGHGYKIGEHTNNGWYYRDELDKYFSTMPEERIRDR